MTQQVPTTAPATNITTPGKPSAMGPPSDTAAAPRPQADARARARDAAKEAMRNANGQFVKTEPEAPTAAVVHADTADSTPEAAEGSGEAAAQTPPEQDLDVRTRVKQREQRIQRELAEKESRLAADRARFDHERQQFEGERQKYQRLDALKRSDPIAWAKEVELDSVMEPIVKARLLAGRPEGQMLTLEQRLAAMEKQREEERQQQQQNFQVAQARHTQQAYVSAAMNAEKFPTLAAVYADDPGELVSDAFKIQRHLMSRRKTADLPSQEEIAQAHERYIREVVSRASKVPAKVAAPATGVAPAAKPKLPPPSDATRTAPIQRNERIQTDRERRDQAAVAARKAMAATNKRK